MAISTRPFGSATLISALSRNICPDMSFVSLENEWQRLAGTKLDAPMLAPR
jgi:hypothetical protein